MKVQMERALSAPLTQVYDLYSSEAFFHRRYAQSGVTDYCIEHCGPLAAAQVIRIELQPVLDLQYLPKAAARWLGRHQRMRYEMRWQRLSANAYTGSFSYQSQDFPVEVSGEIHLTEDQVGCRFVADVGVRCDLPLFGALAARAIGERTVHELGADLDALVNYLTESGSDAGPES